MLLHLFEMTGTTNPTALCHSPEDGNPVLDTGFKLHPFLVEPDSFRGQTEQWHSSFVCDMEFI
jgi:hypothetical protein